MRWALSLLFLLSLSILTLQHECLGEENSTESPLTIRVQVLNFDPFVAEQEKPLHEVCCRCEGVIGRIHSIRNC